MQWFFNAYLQPSKIICRIWITTWTYFDIKWLQKINLFSLKIFFNHSGMVLELSKVQNTLFFSFFFARIDMDSRWYKSARIDSRIRVKLLPLLSTLEGAVWKSKAYYGISLGKYVRHMCITYFVYHIM